ncbi:MAG: hypothetical protein U9N54_06265 [candidate division Zixibacteria bacterium]|nr:hypothetical protein [candidate division Zixibacteria bacterium]RKX21382.1 MAG: hypothetical protein DRP35_04430 [candidate division Zixibacteria bacterium]
MPKRKEPEKFAQLGNKNCWHPYSLQMLSPTKFTLVVGKILRGKYELIRTKNDKRVITEIYH